MMDGQKYASDFYDHLSTNNTYYSPPASVVNTRNEQHQKKRPWWHYAGMAGCSLFALTMVYFAVGAAVNPCQRYSKGCFFQHLCHGHQDLDLASSVKLTADDAFTNALEIKVVPQLQALKPEDTIQPIKLGRRQDDGSNTTSASAPSEGDEPTSPTADDPTDPPTVTTQPTVTETVITTTATETTQEPTTTQETTSEEETSTVVLTTETTTEETTEPIPTTTTTVEPTTTTLDPTTTEEPSSTTEEPSSTEEPSTTEEPTTTEEEEPISTSASRSTITSTLADGGVTVITATSYFEIFPTDGPTGDDSDSDPDLQNAGVATGPAVSLVIALASACYLLV